LVRQSSSRNKNALHYAGADTNSPCDLEDTHTFNEKLADASFDRWHGGPLQNRFNAYCLLTRAAA